MSHVVDVCNDDVSVEFHDGVIDDTWFTSEGKYRNQPTGAGQKQPPVEFDSGKNLADEISSWKSRILFDRIEKHHVDELRFFIAQKLFKVDNILCEESVRLTLIQKLVDDNGILDEQYLDRKYGRDLAGWMRDRLAPAMANCHFVLSKAAIHFNKLKELDPVHNWWRQNAAASNQTARRIQAFAKDMSSKEFLSEFSRLELMLNTDLEPAESTHAIFDKNYITKARANHITCLDSTRVVLRRGLGRKGQDVSEVIHDVFHDSFVHVESNEDGAQTEYGTRDFIHASYVRGGPLANSFICAQAPLENTQTDFWNMVYQEKSRVIVMLCDALDPTTLGPLETPRMKNMCTYYWPRVENESLHFGDLRVKNIRVDGTSDPLFTITLLEISCEDEKENPLLVEHWQWDWQNMNDYHWVFRVLRRARLSEGPTIVHCLDGCGRSGTLVAVEVALSTFLRGAPLQDSIVLLSSLFVRLQRRHAISQPLQYLFIYRALVHFISPYVDSYWNRLALGLTKWPRIGFLTKYEALVREHTSIRPSY